MMSSTSEQVQVDLILPAHNEEKSIESVIREFHRVVAVESSYDLMIYVSEDGSRDETANVIRKISNELPVVLIHSDFRKGYSRAVVDGFRASRAPLVAACDSDGQYDPEDLVALIKSISGHEIAVGYRNPRSDPAVRKVMSWMFRTAYRVIQPGRFRDPSCPFVLFTRPALERVVLDNPRVPFMPQGLWWEISARIAGLEIDYVEVPVRHRQRDEGGSVVYRPRRIPRIVADNLFGLWLTKGDIAFERERLGLNR